MSCVHKTHCPANQFMPHPLAFYTLTSTDLGGRGGCRTTGASWDWWYVCALVCGIPIERKTYFKCHPQRCCNSTLDAAERPGLWVLAQKRVRECASINNVESNSVAVRSANEICSHEHTRMCGYLPLKVASFYARSARRVRSHAMQHKSYASC